MAGTFRASNLVSSLAVFVAYSLGMTLVLLALTVSLGHGPAGRAAVAAPGAARTSTRASGLLLLVAGAYLAHYGWYERRVRSGRRRAAPAPSTASPAGPTASRRWVSDVGPTRLGLLLALGLLFVLTATFGFRTRNR